MFAKKNIALGEFILEYSGEIVDQKEIEKRLVFFIKGSALLALLV